MKINNLEKENFWGATREKNGTQGEKPISYKNLLDINGPDQR